MAFKVGRCLLNKQLKSKGMTQQDLANRLFMSNSQVSQYANNHRSMTLETAKSIANVFGCPIDDLYEWIETPPGPKLSRYVKE